MPRFVRSENERKVITSFSIERQYSDMLKMLSDEEGITASMFLNRILKDLYKKNTNETL